MTDILPVDENGDNKFSAAKTEALGSFEVNTLYEFPADTIIDLGKYDPNYVNLWSLVNPSGQVIDLGSNFRYESIAIMFKEPSQLTCDVVEYEYYGFRAGSEDVPVKVAISYYDYIEGLSGPTELKHKEFDFLSLQRGSSITIKRNLSMRINK